MKLGKDYYQTLGVSPKASSNEIRQAYRRLATLNHPDRNPSTQATLRMQEINEAYNVLGDKRKRNKYDAERGSFSSGLQTTSAPQKKTTMPLQQIFAEDITRPIGFLPLKIATTVLMTSILCILVSNPPFWLWGHYNWFAASYLGWNRELTLIAILSLVSIGGISLLRSSKSHEIEARCPKCRKVWAAEKLSEKFVGALQKNSLLKSLGINVSVTHERYKIHYRCKYCSYEWHFIKTKRQSIF